jgi:biotin carboxyl carrier protein
MSHEIAIEDRGRGDLVVHVDGVAVPVSIVDPRRVRPRGGEHGGGTGAASIVSPMPGRVVKVLVKPGDTVRARQGLVIVEAMKMENELRAPADARVVDVRVTEGMSVDAKAVLVILE